MKIDNVVERIIKKSSNDELKLEYAVIEKMLDIDNVDDTVMIDYLIQTENCIKDEIVDRFMNGMVAVA